jgi:hypothetical protein
MLSLDIWIDKLLSWQAHDCKPEIPLKEQVDPLMWDQVLRSKLLEVIREEEMEMQSKEIMNEESSLIQPSMHSTLKQEGEILRKRTHTNNYSGVEHDNYRQSKMRKIHDGPLNEGMTSYKASEVSITSHSEVPRIRPKVSMKNVFEDLEALKQEVKEGITDDKNKNIIHLKYLRSDQMDIPRCLNIVHEHNSRAPKILYNCLKNVSRRNTEREYTLIRPEMYTSMIPQKMSTDKEESMFHDN